MKIQFFKRGSFGLMLAIPLVGGCNQQAGESPQNLVTLAFAEPAVQAVAETNAIPAPAVPEAAPAPVGKAEAVPAALEEKPLPPTIKASGPLAEVIKLAQAGVDDGVMLTYITNSTSTFSLSSDEIIYLNDIGVANNVVTTMIEHDQAMKQYWANAAQAQAAATAPAPQTQAEETATAPSYVNPPQAAPAEPQPEIVNNNYFYDTLSPYGSWVNVDGYGLCWQPTAGVVNRSWQPYCDRGHWVYTDCGWYWLSDYSWGATTFHYGRWFSHPRWGWCWWPDRVWGPSWVTWRSGGDYCGWAPLPPFAFYRPGFGFTFHGRSVGFNFDFGIGASWYTFVPFSRFCDPHPYRHRFPSHQVTQVFNKTTIINNFGSGSHNTVINHGIAPDRITSITRQEIRKVSIRDAGPTLARGTRGERLENNGRTLTVHRPNVPEGRLEPRRTTSDNPGKGSPYAPLQTAGENSSRGNQATSTPNRRADPRPATTRSTFDNDRSSRPPRNASDSQPNWRTDDIRRGNDRAAQAAAPAKQTTPASPIVVIGRRDAAQPRDRSTATAPPPQTRVAEVEPRDMQVRPAPSTPSRNPYSQPTAPSTAPLRNYNPSPVAPQPIQRQEIPRSTRSFETRPSYSEPATVQRQTAPSYSPPPSAPAPTPRYERPASPPPSSYQQSAPRSAPAPSYSPPASSPAPVQRAQPSAPSRSESGGGPKGRNQ